jgi:hypothetical protein
MQNILVSIQGKNVEELKERIRELAKHWGVLEQDPQMPLPIAKTAKAADAVESESEETAPVAPAKRGRKPKSAAAPVAPVTEDAEEVEEQEVDAPSAPAKGSAPTKDELEATVRKVFNNPKHGVAAARKILSKYNAQRVSELKPENFANVISDCQALLG